MVEIGDDCAEHAEAPELMLMRSRPGDAPHQEKPGNFRWRSPGANVAFGFIVEQLFAMKSGTAMLPERAGEFATAGVPELVST